jgi:hypothetical protein
MSFKKIFAHPDVNLIVKRLSRGDGVRKVANILKEMHPKDRKLHISAPTLQKFRVQHLKIEGEALAAIKQAVKEKAEIKEYKKEHTKVKNLPAYKEKLKEAIDLHIEIRTELQEMFVLLKARFEDLFDKLQTGDASVSDEQSLHKYFQIWITAIEKQAKYIDKVADHTVETTSVNITVIQDQMTVLREAVRETMLEEMTAESQIRFLEKLDNKMRDLNYRQGASASFENIHSDVKSLTVMAEDVETDDGN